MQFDKIQHSFMIKYSKIRYRRNITKNYKGICDKAIASIILDEENQSKHFPLVWNNTRMPTFATLSQCSMRSYQQVQIEDIKIKNIRIFVREKSQNTHVFA